MRGAVAPTIWKLLATDGTPRRRDVNGALHAPAAARTACRSAGTLAGPTETRRRMARCGRSAAWCTSAFHPPAGAHRQAARLRSVQRGDGPMGTRSPVDPGGDVRTTAARPERPSADRRAVGPWRSAAPLALPVTASRRLGRHRWSHPGRWPPGPARKGPSGRPAETPANPRPASSGRPRPRLARPPPLPAPFGPGVPWVPSRSLTVARDALTPKALSGRRSLTPSAGGDSMA